MNSSPLQQSCPAGDRARWMSVLARAPAEALAQRADALPTGHLWLRRPETGLVMVRGRVGGSGAAFNLGEMSVTRCALRLADGTVGMAYLRGRAAHQAERAALIDALMQQAARRGEIDLAWATWIAPLEARLAEQRGKRAAAAAQTRVEFFTIVRGEDAP